MLTCRDIPEEDWAKARERLIYYFSRGHGLDNASDLAQETLAVLLARDDFQFQRREDFLPVCLGFARRVGQSGYRKEFRYSGGPLPDDLPGHPSESAQATERNILTSQILNKAKAGLRPGEYDLMLNDSASSDPAEANRVRVTRHRAIQKVVRMLGLDRSGR
ncbi:MAG: hypothetical protein ABI693_17475 [Bryobacteraceae bacterium]